MKEIKRREKNERTRLDQEVRAETGIRVLRERPVFTTPNVYAPRDEDFVALSHKVRSARRSRSSTATSASSRYRELHAFYDQLCPSCGDFNFAKRTETADLRGRVALLTGGRVKIGYQAGIKLLRAGAELIVTTRFPRDAAARYATRGGLRGLARPARDPRARPAAHAERRGLLRAPARDARPARLHRQQRVPDRAAAAGLLPSHARRRDSGRAGAARPRPRAPRRLRGPPRRRARAGGGASDPAGGALAGAAPARGRAAPRPLPRGPPRPGSAAGRPARHGTRGASCSRRCRPSSCSRRSS